MTQSRLFVTYIHAQVEILNLKTLSRLAPTAPPEEDESKWPELVDVIETRKMFEANITIPPPPPMAPPPPPINLSAKRTGTW